MGKELTRKYSIEEIKKEKYINSQNMDNISKKEKKRKRKKKQNVSMLVIFHQILIME